MSFTDEQLSKWALDREREISAVHNFIIDRVSLNIVSGTYDYALPNYLSNIRAVIYKGYRLEPFSETTSRYRGNTPLATSPGTPLEYLFSGRGGKVIRLYPTPNENLIPGVGDLYSIAVENSCAIVEFYRTAHNTDEDLKIPEQYRRYFLKNHVCWRAFTMEGCNQDLRAGGYYNEKIMRDDTMLNSLRQRLFQSYLRVLVNNSNHPENIRRPRGVLPDNFPRRSY